ncbi:MAG: ATP-binding protein [Candidatus Thermoplasmatota archaeon]|nr:ATP-binding protein [Candidatus Thermoplasmatota archaeon]MBS3802367.1 ATP-binding protein [Candidatus Thermoplasmatota archaeon]
MMIYKAKKLLWNVISSGLTHSHDIEPLRKVMLINLITLSGFSILMLLSIITYIQQAYFLTLIDGVFGVLVIGLFFYLRKFKKIERVAILGSVLSGLFFFILLFNGGVNNTSFIWSLTYPLISLFLLGSKKGSIFSLTLLGLSAVVFIFGEQVPFFTSYSTDIVLRFIPAYFIIYLFALVMERVREQVQNNLTDSNIKLKKAHDTLRLFNKELETKIEARTTEIKKLLKQKDEFINQLGHDLKNPLGPPISLLPILEKHVTNQKDKDMLNVVKRNINYMKSLVQKTLTLAQLNSPNTTLSKKRINLKEEFQVSITQNKYLFEKKQISISSHIPDDTFVYADQIRLEELLNNLLNNAIKYNNQHVSIDINVSEKDSMLVTSIQDDGVGMSAEQLDHIFDEFYKADESRHDFDSSGLGMPICKRIVEKHGGKIWAESKGIGKGTTVFFTFPKKEFEIDKKNNTSTYKEIVGKIDEIIE